MKLPHMALLMNQGLHNFNQRVGREIFGVQGYLIHHFTAAVSGDKTSEAEIPHCVFAPLKGDQAVGKLPVKQPPVIKVKSLLKLGVSAFRGSSHIQPHSVLYDTDKLEQKKNEINLYLPANKAASAPTGAEFCWQKRTAGAAAGTDIAS